MINGGSDLSNCVPNAINQVVLPPRLLISIGKKILNLIIKEPHGKSLITGYRKFTKYREEIKDKAGPPGDPEVFLHAITNMCCKLAGESSFLIKFLARV